MIVCLIFLINFTPWPALRHDRFRSPAVPDTMRPANPLDSDRMRAEAAACRPLVVRR